MRYNTISEFEEHPLKARVEKCRLRQYDIAKFCGCSQGYISQIFRGLKEMPTDIEHKILEAVKRFEKPQKIKKQ